MKTFTTSIIMLLAVTLVLAGVLVAGCTQSNGSTSGSAGSSQQASPTATYRRERSLRRPPVLRAAVPHQHDPAQCRRCPAGCFRAGPPECPDTPERAADEPYFRGSPARCHTAAAPGSAFPGRGTGSQDRASFPTRPCSMPPLRSWAFPNRISRML